MIQIFGIFLSAAIYNNYVEYIIIKYLYKTLEYSIFKNITLLLILVLGAPPPNVCFAAKGRLRPMNRKENGARILLHFEDKPQPFYVGEGSFRSQLLYATDFLE